MTPPLIGAISGAVLILCGGCSANSSTSTSTATTPSVTTPSAPTAATPAATLHILGLIEDAFSNDVSDVSILVVDGSATGAHAKTDASGRFELIATITGATQTSLAVAKDGFQNATIATTWRPLTDHSPLMAMTFLKTSAAPMVIAVGNYDLTVSMDPGSGTTYDDSGPCDGFPADLLSRSYSATIQPVPASWQPTRWDYNVVVTAPGLNPRLAQFPFEVDGTSLAFELEGGFDSFLESLPGFRYLMIGGVSSNDPVAISDGPTLTVPFSGVFSSCQLKSGLGLYNDCSQVPPDQRTEYHGCFSSSLKMVFAKR